MTGRIQRRFVTVGGRQVHYLRAGSGPAVVLEHPSPMASQLFLPLLQSLSDRYTVIVPDRPGAGLSDPLDLEQPTIADYAEALEAALDAIGVGAMVLYGMSTGSMVSLELTLREPERIEALVLENLPVATAEEQGEQLEQYSPAALIKPEWDGSHLVRSWNFARGVWAFWPWFRREVPTRRDINMPPPHAVQEMMMGATAPGPASGRIYDAVWHYSTEVLPRLHELEKTQVPTTIVGREDDVCFATLGRLPALDSSITVRALERRHPPRWPTFFWSVEVEEIIRDAQPSGATPPDRSTIPLRDGMTRCFVDAPGGQMLVRQGGAGDARTLILLHSCPGSGPGSSRALEPLMRPLAQSRPVAAIDLAGLGDSDAADGADPSMSQYARSLTIVLDGLGLDVVDVYGRGFGALVAVELAARNPERVGDLVLDCLPLYTPEEREDLLANFPVDDFTPRIDGAHVVAAWTYVRDATLWWPPHNRTREGIIWVNPPPPQVVHDDVLDLFRARDLGAGIRVMCTYPVRDRLGLIAARTLLCHRHDGFADRYLAEAQTLLPSAGSRALLEGPPEDEAAVIDDFLAGVGAGSV